MVKVYHVMLVDLAGTIMVYCCFEYSVHMYSVRLGHCFTPYQRLRLYNAPHLVAFYDTLGIRRTYSRLKPRRPHGGERFVLLRDMAILNILARSGDRVGDLGQLLTYQIEQLPGDEGAVLYLTTGKIYEIPELLL